MRLFDCEQTHNQNNHNSPSNGRAGDKVKDGQGQQGNEQEKPKRCLWLTLRPTACQTVAAVIFFEGGGPPFPHFGLAVLTLHFYAPWC